jgi:hypothetical protein
VSFLTKGKGSTKLQLVLIYKFSIGSPAKCKLSKLPGQSAVSWMYAGRICPQNFQGLEKITVQFRHTSKGSKIALDDVEVRLQTTPPGAGEARSAAVLPPPAAPAGFRGTK